MGKLDKKLKGSVKATALAESTPKADFAPRQKYAFRLFLDGNTAKKYDIGAEPEIVMEQRLRDCADHTAEKPIYFNDEQRRALDALFDYNFDSAQQVIDRVRNMSKFTVEGLTVELTMKQLQRLSMQCPYGMTLPERLSEVVKTAIKVEAGEI